MSEKSKRSYVQHDLKRVDTALRVGPNVRVRGVTREMAEAIRLARGLEGLPHQETDPVQHHWDALTRALLNLQRMNYKWHPNLLRRELVAKLRERAQGRTAQNPHWGWVLDAATALCGYLAEEHGYPQGVADVLELLADHFEGIPIDIRSTEHRRLRGE